MAITVDKTTTVIRVSGTTAAATVVTDEPVMIQGILWFNSTTNGHKLDLSTKDGKFIFRGNQSTANISNAIQITFPLGLYVPSIYVNDLDSGQVYIYIK